MRIAAMRVEELDDMIRLGVPLGQGFALDGDVAEVARGAMSRPRARRFEPEVCCDEVGCYAGLVHFERLVEQLSS